MSRAAQWLCGVLLLILGTAQAKPFAWKARDLVYRFPTANHRILDGDGEGFFMYCDRNFEGKKSKPWQAGGYGMVRTPFRASDGSVMFSHMHEGIDIKPMRRGTDGEPLDLVYPIAPGVVAYTNPSPTLSNYGRYVVVAHRVPEGMIFSLYAHLARVDCRIGQRVGTGNSLGRMGHSGAGINKERSHVHLEICLMLHSEYDKFCPPTNKHGVYNGFNLVGIDPVPVLLACRDGKPLSLAKHWETLREHYRVRVPYSGERIDLLRRHPFLLRGKCSPGTRSLDIAFSAEGVPLGFYVCETAVASPRVIRCLPQPTLQQNVTANRVKNSSRNPELTVSGQRYIRHLLRPQGAPPATPAKP